MAPAGSKLSTPCCMKKVGKCEGTLDKEKRKVASDLEAVKLYLGVDFIKLDPSKDEMCGSCRLKVRRQAKLLYAKKRKDDEDSHQEELPKRTPKRKSFYGDDKCVDDSACASAVVVNEVCEVESLALPHKTSSSSTSKSGKESSKKSQKPSNEEDTSTYQQSTRERVIVDLDCLEQVAQTSVDHRRTCRKAKFVVTNRSWINLDLTCISCGERMAIRKDNPKEHELPLNEAMVVGAYSAGIGYSSAKYLLNAAEIDFIHSHTYQTAEREVGTKIEKAIKEDTTAAIEEEKRLAIEAGDFAVVDGETYPFFTGTVDGGYAKRSYGHAYDSNAGCAVIIGKRTNKVLYVGSRVKCCAVCDKSPSGVEAPTHSCYKNWDGTTPAMESDIIVNGALELYETHNFIMKYVIGDADSSVFSKLQCQLKYPEGMAIEKIDCINHAVRGINTKLFSLINNTAFPKAHRDMLDVEKNRIGRAVRAAINYNCKHQNDTDPLIRTTVKTLAQDFMNIFPHVFGDHSKCRSYFCHGGCVDNKYLQIRPTDIGQELALALARLATRSQRLIPNQLSNPAETFMSIIAKYISGKRINYAQRQGYSQRVDAAALCFNHGPFWALEVLNKQKDERSQVWTKAAKYFQRRKSKKKEGTAPFGRRKQQTKSKDVDYGTESPQGNFSIEELKHEVDVHVFGLNVTTDQRDTIEKDTRGQFFNTQWQLERGKRISATLARDIVTMKDSTSNDCTLRKIARPQDLSHNENVLRGITLEPVARELYHTLYGVEANECGLFVSLETGILCASPDATVGEKGLLEIKCPNCPPEDIPKRQDKFLIIEKETGKLVVNRKHKYFRQAVIQMYCAEKEFVDFFVLYDNKSQDEPYKHFRERIERDSETDKMWDQVKEKCIRFFMEDMAPEAVDPVFPKFQKFRTPEYRRLAMEKAQANKERRLAKKNGGSSTQVAPSSSGV